MMWGTHTARGATPKKTPHKQREKQRGKPMQIQTSGGGVRELHGYFWVALFGAPLFTKKYFDNGREKAHLVRRARGV